MVIELFWLIIYGAVVVGVHSWLIYLIFRSVDEEGDDG